MVQQRKNRLDPLCPNGLDADVADHQPPTQPLGGDPARGLPGLPAELARVDALLDDPKFLAPLASHFDPRIGRPSMPLDTYLRIMFLKFRSRLGYELVRRELQASISWQRFCRIPLGGRVPHPTTLVKLTRRLGEPAGTALNQALLATAGEHKVLRTHRVRVDTTVVAADVGYPTDAGLLARAIGKLQTTIGAGPRSAWAATGETRPGCARSRRCCTTPAPPHACRRPCASWPTSRSTRPTAAASRMPSRPPRRPGRHSPPSPSAESSR